MSGNKFFLGITVAAVAIAVGIVSAQANDGRCAGCYRKVEHPAVYGRQAETVVVRPAQTVAHTIPAEYRTVAEQHLVSAARREWRVTRDHHGHEIGCWVDIPAQYETRHRQVMVSPARVVHSTIPAVTEVRHRAVLVRPATSAWEPVGHARHAAPHHPHHGHHGHHGQRGWYQGGHRY